MHSVPGFTAFLFAWMLATAVEGAQLFVSVSGNDANDCLSPSRPRATLQAAVGKAPWGRPATLRAISCGVYAPVDVIYYKLVSIIGEE